MHIMMIRGCLNSLPNFEESVGLSLIEILRFSFGRDLLRSVLLRFLLNRTEFRSNVSISFGMSKRTKTTNKKRTHKNYSIKWQSISFGCSFRLNVRLHKKREREFIRSSCRCVKSNQT